MPDPPVLDRRPSILLVDDRVENHRALEAVLEPLDCRVVTAISGREALKLLLDEQFAAILLDVQMPDMDGFETASYIRDRHRTRAIPIIFMSAVSTSTEHVFRGYEAGAVDYIVKPIDPVVVRSKVRVFIELYERGEEIRRQADILRQRDLEAAERATEQRRHRRAVLLDALSFALEKRTDIDGRISQLVRSCVPDFADFALAESFPSENRGGAVALACSDPADQADLRTLGPRHEVVAPSRDREAGRARGRLDPKPTRHAWLELLPGVLGEQAWSRLAPSSAITFPLQLRGEQLGRLVLARSRAEAFGDEEFELASELARRASMALETSRLYELERERSRALQLSLLGESQLVHPIVTSASRYLPGAADLEVGGDWCDLIQREDGRILAVVGDVVGRGIRAATAMGKLRSAVAALALESDDVAHLLERLDQFAARIPEADLATAVCALIDAEDGTVMYSSAGHLPALVVGPAGGCRFLEEPRGFPLGVDRSVARRRGRVRLVAGSTLILFTDGLVEARDLPIEAGLERLRAAASARASLEPERLCDELVGELVDGPGDDVALVCLRLAPRPADSVDWQFPALPRRLAPARHALDAWLEHRDVSASVRADLVLAFAEACSNAVRHAYVDCEGTVTAHLRVDDGVLTIRVRDTGRWLDGHQSADGGRGLEIIRALVDDLHVHGTSRGTTVLMQKRLWLPDAVEPPAEAATSAP